MIIDVSLLSKASGSYPTPTPHAAPREMNVPDDVESRCYVLIRVDCEPQKYRKAPNLLRLDHRRSPERGPEDGVPELARNAEAKLVV